MKYSLQFLKLHWILSFKWFFVAKTSPKSNNRNKRYTKIILMKYFSIEVFQSPVSFSSENIKLIIVWRTYLPYDHSPITKGIFLNYISKKYSSLVSSVHPASGYFDHDLFIFFFFGYMAQAWPYFTLGLIFLI